MRYGFFSVTALAIFACRSGAALAYDDHAYHNQSPLHTSSSGCSECAAVSAPSSRPAGCSTNSMPSCTICGGNRGCDCSDQPGVDVDSLTPAAQSKKLYEASLARITFVLPEDAGVTLMERRMSTLGPKRSFVVSVSDQTMDFKYEVKVDVVRNGKKYFRKLKIIDLRAGMILAIAVDAPPVSEEEPAQITLESTVVAMGGKPPDERTDVDGKPPAELTSIRKFSDR